MPLSVGKGAGCLCQRCAAPQVIADRHGALRMPCWKASGRRLVAASFFGTRGDLKTFCASPMQRNVRTLGGEIDARVNPRVVVGSHIAASVARGVCFGGKSGRRAVSVGSHRAAILPASTKVGLAASTAMHFPRGELERSSNVGTLVPVR